MAGYDPSKTRSAGRVRDDLLFDSEGIEHFVVTIDKTAEDAGSPNGVTYLRKGLLLGKVTATGRYKQFDGAAVDGTQLEEDMVILKQDIEVTPTGEHTVAASYKAGNFYLRSIFATGTVTWANHPKIRVY